MYSIKHEYEGKWNDEKTRLTTCDPKGNVNSNTPQEVQEKKEIIFTYDVEFQVISCTVLQLMFSVTGFYFNLIGRDNEQQKEFSTIV